MNVGEEIETIDSDDEVILNSSSKSDDKPLMILLTKLIAGKKQHTVLTNFQLLDILQKEFNICRLNYHDLAVEIFMNIIKKFLKDWPEWDKFDKVVASYKELNKMEHDAICTILNDSYLSLKQFLKDILHESIPLTEEAVQEVTDEINNSQTPLKEPINDTNKVILKINCTREQLDQLFLKYPLNDNIFNVINKEPFSIRIINHNMESIMFGSLVSIFFAMPSLQFKCLSAHEIAYKVVNKKILSKEPLELLNHTVLEKPHKNVPKHYNVNKVKKMLEKLKLFVNDYSTDIINDINLTSESQNFVDIIFKVFRRNVSYLPNVISSNVWYKKYGSLHPYVTNHYKDNSVNIKSIDEMKVDLHLEEKIYPQVQFCLSEIHQKAGDPRPKDSTAWIILECMYCKKLFKGLSSILNEMVFHFNESHHSEPLSWTCTKCNKSFNVSDLARDSWFHNCKN